MKNHLSEEILDILNESPRWVVRMGATVILFILLLFLAGSWYIRYPEVLKGDVMVTTSAPTLKVVAEREGRIMRILSQNGAMVHKGDVLAEMENRTKLENTPALQRLLSQTQSFLQDPRQAVSLPDVSLTWGDLQTDVQVLRQNYLDYKQLQNDGFYKAQIQRLRVQKASIYKLQSVQQRKKALNQSEFSNASDGYVTDKKLFTEGIYSKSEFQKKENEYLKKKGEQEDLEETMIRNELKINEIEQEIQDLEFAFSEKQRICLDKIGEAAQNIANGLHEWQQRFLVTAPSDGKLNFLQNLNDNQYVKSGETLFAVIPEQQEFIAMVEIPVRGLGKASIGQKVVLKLDDYPYQEFGTVEGLVTAMAPSVDLKTYRMQVSLPNGLRSSFHQQFICKSAMAGTAEIITADLRLVERAFYGIRKLWM